MKKKAQTEVQPMQVDPKFLQELLQNQAKEKKNIIRLHYHPEQIKQSLKDMREFAEEEEMKNLFEDLDILTNWALARLPLVKPEDLETSEETKEDNDKGEH